MKASEIVKILQKGIEQHGDLEVYTVHPNQVFGKVSKRPVATWRSKSSPRNQWNGLHEQDKGEKVFSNDCAFMERDMDKFRSFDHLYKDNPKASWRNHYGHCSKFDKPVSFSPGVCQIDTQECFVHRKDI
jgi:hypothetical protein